MEPEKIRLALIKVAQLESEALHDLKTMAHGKSSGMTDYIQLNGEAAPSRLKMFQMALAMNDLERQRWKNYPNEGILRDMGDLISNVLILCNRARSADWAKIAVPENRAFLYAGVPTRTIEKLNADRYSRGIEDTDPGFLQSGFYENPN